MWPNLREKFTFLRRLYKSWRIPWSLISPSKGGILVEKFFLRTEEDVKNNTIKLGTSGYDEQIDREKVLTQASKKKYYF